MPSAKILSGEEDRRVASGDDDFFFDQPAVSDELYLHAMATMTGLVASLG